MRNYKNIFSNVDWVVIIIYLVFVLIGWINIYAAVYNEEHYSIIDVTQRYGKQLIWIVLALIIALVILLVESQFFTSFAIPIYVFVLLSLVQVFVLHHQLQTTYYS